MSEPESSGLRHRSGGSTGLPTDEPAEPQAPVRRTRQLLEYRRVLAKVRCTDLEFRFSLGLTKE